jgi:PAS domain S-box-containing protein
MIGNYRILVLDDDVALGDLLKAFLETSGPFSVEQIIMGSDLLGRLGSTSYHLLLLDFHLPDMTGLDVLNLLSGSVFRIPVIMLTGKGDEHTAAEAIKRGASEYLIKNENFWSDLPGLINKAIRLHELQQAVIRSEEALRKSEEKFRTLYETMSQGVIYQDLNGRVHSANPAAERILGFPLQQIIGSTLYDLKWHVIHEDGSAFQEEIFPPLVALMTGKPVKDVVMGLAHPGTGITSWIRVESVPQFLPGVTIPYQVYSTFEDISEHKRADNILQSRLVLMQFADNHSLQELLQAALDEAVRLTGSSLGFYTIYDETSRMVTQYAWSTSIHKEFDEPVELDLNYNFNDLLGWVDCIHSRRAVIHNGFSKQTHLESIFCGRTQIWRELVVPVFRGGQIVAILGVGNKAYNYSEVDIEIISRLADLTWDIAENKQKEEALQESEEKHRSLFETLTQGVLYHDSLGRILSANAAAEIILGLPVLKMKGRTLFEALEQAIHEDGSYFSPETYPVMVALKTGDPVKDVVMGFCQVGKENCRWVNIHAIPQFKSGEQDPYEVYVTLSDITERKLKDARIQQANLQLMESARLSAVGQLATGVAHQISNPLTAILGEAQLLLQSLPEDDEMRESIQTIETAGWRAQWAVEILNTFSEPAPESKSRIDLYQTVKLALSLVGGNFYSDGVTLSLDLSGDSPCVMGNSHQIESLWVNLLLFTRRLIEMKSCTLSIRAVDLPDGYIAIDAHLDGISVAETHLKRVFDPELIFNSDDAISGMEFSICQEIARQNKGSIEVSYQPNETIFRVILPKEI